jgi:hypothetical protein
MRQIADVCHHTFVTKRERRLHSVSDQVVDAPAPFGLPSAEAKRDSCKGVAMHSNVRTFPPQRAASATELGTMGRHAIRPRPMALRFIRPEHKQ